MERRKTSPGRAWIGAALVTVTIAAACGRSVPVPRTVAPPSPIPDQGGEVPLAMPPGGRFPPQRQLIELCQRDDPFCRRERTVFTSLAPPAIPMPQELSARCPGTTSGEGALDARTRPPVEPSPLPVVTETLAYEGADAVTVPAFLSRPVGGEPVPGVVYVHGGLAQPATPDPGRTIAAAGFAVLTPAYRGTQLDGLSVGDALRMSDIGHADARDVLRGAYWLLSQPFVSGAVALVGSSLGGGIANVLAFLYPDVWDAVVTLDAVTDWACVVTYLGLGSDQARVIATAFGGAPEDVPEEYRRVSPVYHADRVAAPYYVVQGLGDTLSPAGESQKWVDALRAARVAVTWRPYDGQRHGFMRRLPFDSGPWQDLFAWLHDKLRGAPRFPLPAEAGSLYAFSTQD